MEAIRLVLTPRSAFGTRPRGDTLFGQLCWAIRYRFGSQLLLDLLDGYTRGKPFAVVSDMMPAGHVPRPITPLSWLDGIAAEERKTIKKKTWLPVAALPTPDRWLRDASDLSQLDANKLAPLTEETSQPHNSISRLTGTTGPVEFAPYQMEQIWYRAGVTLDCYVVYDSRRLGADQVVQLFADMGQTGFGRDATIGLGRFDVRRGDGGLPTSSRDADAYLTLAPCVPQGHEWNATRCFYHPFTRFGRHGGEAAVLTGKPFKTPILMADCGAVLTPSRYSPQLLVGTGLGGDGSLSKSMPQTVHQGYAPVIGITLPARRA
jgi:CRISPR-associated protein Csm4